MKLSPEEVQQLYDKFFGKKITVPFVYKGAGSPKPTVAGVCTFIGYNKHFPNRGLQVTVDRLPVTDVDHTTIKLLEEETDYRII